MKDVNGKALNVGDTIVIIGHMAGYAGSAELGSTQRVGLCHKRDNTFKIAGEEMLNAVWFNGHDAAIMLTNKSNAIVNTNMMVSTLIAKITGWHYDRNLIDGSDDKSQFAKLIQECGELSDNICKSRDISDDIGDIMVVLVNIAERNRLSIQDCLEAAWFDIKDRKGQMRDGVFIKEADL
jgi:hypothetical protein